MTDIRWGILATGGIAHAFARDLRTADLDLAPFATPAQEPVVLDGGRLGSGVLGL